MSWPRYTTLAPPERQRPNSHWNQSDFSLLGGRGRFASPPMRHAHRPSEERPSPPRSPGPYTGASALSSSEKAATVGTPSRLACLMSWTGRRCPTSWTDVRCRFFSRLHSTPWSRTNSNSWRISSSRFGLKLYPDITRSLLTCGNTYKQTLVRGSVPSSREE
jgi:hypothetical protein